MKEEQLFIEIKMRMDPALKRAALIIMTFLIIVFFIILFFTLDLNDELVPKSEAELEEFKKKARPIFLSLVFGYPAILTAVYILTDFEELYNILTFIGIAGWPLIPILQITLKHFFYYV